MAMRHSSTFSRTFLLRSYSSYSQSCSTLFTAKSTPYLTRFAVAPVRIATTPTPSRWLTSSALLNSKRYTSAHEWIELSDDQKTATIGISTYAAKALGDVVFVELPATGQEVAAGDAIGAVESVKSASDIYAPISGTIVEGNAVLEERPGTINKGPEEEGWIARMEVTDPEEISALMDEEAYRSFTEE
ncbi:glycine cleavage system H-protein subunit [Xylographa opegraphella]|nr:glycine cleavage system H-protein subunit [Xylographa opegraphella]